jgi:hypothetical protein
LNLDRHDLLKINKINYSLLLPMFAHKRELYVRESVRQ